MIAQQQSFHCFQAIDKLRIALGFDFAQSQLIRCEHKVDVVASMNNATIRFGQQLVDGDGGGYRDYGTTFPVKRNFRKLNKMPLTFEFVGGVGVGRSKTF